MAWEICFVEDSAMYSINRARLEVLLGGLRGALGRSRYRRANIARPDHALHCCSRSRDAFAESPVGNRGPAGSSLAMTSIRKREIEPLAEGPARRVPLNAASRRRLRGESGPSIVEQKKAVRWHVARNNSQEIKHKDQAARQPGFPSSA
jgi:hypothetical protein